MLSCLSADSAAEKEGRSDVSDDVSSRRWKELELGELCSAAREAVACFINGYGDELLCEELLERSMLLGVGYKLVSSVLDRVGIVAGDWMGAGDEI